MEQVEAFEALTISDQENPSPDTPITAPFLPTELLEIIIAFIPLPDGDGDKTLKACTLVSSRLRYICQRRLFATINLGFVNQFPTSFSPDRFYQLIEQSPHICPFVTQLDLQVFDLVGWSGVVDQVEQVVNILPRLPNLAILDLEPSNKRSIQYPLLNARLQQALIRRCLSINEVRIYNMQDLSDELWINSPTLYSLQLTGCSFATDDSKPDVGVSIKPALKLGELYFYSSSEDDAPWKSFVRWRARHMWIFESERLTKLSIIVYFHLFERRESRLAAAQTLHDILRLALPTVEFLHVYIPPPSDMLFTSGPEFLNLSVAPNLTTFYLTFHIWGAHRAPTVRYNNILWFTSILSTIPHRTNIKKMMVVFSVIDYSSVEDDDDDVNSFPEEPWSHFERVIQRLAETIDLSVGLRIFRYTQNPRSILILSSILKSSIAAGTLRIDEESTD